MTGWLTIVDSECDSSDTGPDHRLLVIVELDCLMIERERFEFIIKEEVDCLLVKLESETLQEWNVVVYQFIVKFEVTRNQLIQKWMSKHVN